MWISEAPICIASSKIDCSSLTTGAAAAMAAALALGKLFAVVLGSYIVLVVLYSAVLKRVVFIDVLVLAAGFVLRVVGGAVAIDVPVSRWLLLCAYLLALYLALGKRRSELALLGDDAGTHREVLGHYSLGLVDQAISVVLGATVLAYTLYTVAPDTVARVVPRGIALEGFRRSPDSPTPAVIPVKAGKMIAKTRKKLENS